MWIKYNPNPMAQQTDDCAVRALAAALDIDWETAYTMLASNAFAMATMPSSHAVMAATLRKEGFYRAAIPNNCPDCYTAEDFCRDNPDGIFVLSFGSHIATVVNGNLYDSWDSSHEIPQFYYYRKE